MANVTLQLGNATAQLTPENPRVIMGREATCGLAHPDPTMSRRHAEIYLEGTTVFIRDLGSANGTWVDGQPVGQQPVALRPGQAVYLGQNPLQVTGFFGGREGATMAMQVTPELLKMIEGRKAEMAAAAVAPAPVAVPSTGTAGAVGVGGRVGPTPAEMTYRRQGANANGSLLIALKGDTFTNASTIDGFAEFTALDEENVASIIVELIEYHKKLAKDGHVWDRFLVRQGPWKTRKGDILPLPFQLRVPPGTSMSSPDCWWEIRGYVNIDWAFDIEAKTPINMRNIDVERIRDALGALDYRIVNFESQNLGQRYVGKFVPPAQWRSEWGINEVNLGMEYLGTNLQVRFEVKKTSMFKFDKLLTTTFDLEQLRSAQIPQVTAHFKQQIDQMMGKK